MRLFLAIGWFFKILIRGRAAFAGAPLPDASKPIFATSSEPAIQLLALLQKEGRLLDFLREDISSYGDADVGAAVRSIHAGCGKVLADRMALRRIVDDSEGASVTLEAGFNPSHYDLVGDVAGDPPYSGRLVHGGWYVEEIDLPTVPESADPKVAAPAQVEVRPA